MSNAAAIVIHITSGERDDWQMALRNLVNLVGENSVSTPPERMQVVVNGEAVRFLLSSGPDAAKVTQMVESGVQIDACSNSLDRLGYSSEELADGVTSVPAGVAEVTRTQQRGGTYLKLP
jgi:intracellular sulfur oxidation DsrE/DsrF family protein